MTCLSLAKQPTPKNSASCTVFLRLTGSVCACAAGCVCCSGVATQLDECRLWLRGTQSFVLQLQKQVQGFAEEGQPSTASVDAGFSLQDGGCSTSTAPNSAASLNAWRMMCQEASDTLGCVAESMASGGAEVGMLALAHSVRLFVAGHGSAQPLLGGWAACCWRCACLARPSEVCLPWVHCSHHQVVACAIRLWVMPMGLCAPHLSVVCSAVFGLLVLLCLVCLCCAGGAGRWEADEAGGPVLSAQLFNTLVQKGSNLMGTAVPRAGRCTSSRGTRVHLPNPWWVLLASTVILLLGVVGCCCGGAGVSQSCLTCRAASVRCLAWGHWLFLGLLRCSNSTARCIPMNSSTPVAACVQQMSYVHGTALHAPDVAQRTLAGGGTISCGFCRVFLVSRIHGLQTRAAASSTTVTGRALPWT